MDRKRFTISEYLEVIAADGREAEAEFIKKYIDSLESRIFELKPMADNWQRFQRAKAMKLLKDYSEFDEILRLRDRVAELELELKP